MSAELAAPFDYLAPDYVSVFKQRAEFLARIREADAVAQLKCFYAANPVRFIADWGIIFEPRNVEIGLPATIPFVPFPRQVQWLEWVLERWHARQRGITAKARGSGVSWLAVSLSCTLCLFNRGLVVGFGSRKAEYVDALGDPKSLFFKARMFMNHLPPEFRGEWSEREHAREMRITFPHEGSFSAMTGESGDNIGRGDRTSLYFVDEAGFLEHSELAEGSLTDTTNCRIDISTSPGSNTTFADRLLALPEQQQFWFRYQDDPRRDAAWELKKRAEIADGVFAREYGISFDEGGSFFSEASLLVGGQPVDTPERVDAVFATIDSAVKTGKKHDGLAVTYFARVKFGQLPHPLYVLDWDLKQIEGALLETWLPTVFKHLEQLALLTKSRHGSVGALIEDKSSGSVLLQQAHNKGWPAKAIDSKLTAMGKSERAINVSGYVHAGQVKFTRTAHERVVTYKSVTKNHLLAQVLAFRAGGEDQIEDDCLDTFCYGVALALGNKAGF